MSNDFSNEQPCNADDFHFSMRGDMTGLAPWIEIEPGRFMPRRVRGSFQGRALG